MSEPTSTDRSSQARGRWGEDLAARHYRRLGYDVLDRNWRLHCDDRRGELDIVARRDDTLVFCEVKTRRRPGYGGAVAAVDRRKQVRVRRLAAAWLAEHDVRGAHVRFDVAAIEGVRLTVYEGAF